MILDALWPNEYHVMVGEEFCGEIDVKRTEITCLPPETKPFDSRADKPRVRVSPTE